MTAQEFELAIAFYLTDLAAVAGVTPKRLRRILESGGVTMLPAGRRVMVSRVGLLNGMPEIYEALLLRIRARDSEDAGDCA